MLENLVALVFATMIMVAIPGPNAALIVACTLRGGMRAGLSTIAGITLGLAMQLTLVVFGLTTVLSLAADAFHIIKWCGVAYLLWLGYRSFHATVDHLDVDQSPEQSNKSMFLTGILVALLNPKTLLFQAAFIPQFLPAETAGNAFWILVLAVTHLVTGALGDTIWAATASRARTFLIGFQHIRHKAVGAFYILASIGLAATRR